MGQRFTIKTPSAFEDMLTRFGQLFGNGVCGAPIGKTSPPIPGESRQACSVRHVRPQNSGVDCKIEIVPRATSLRARVISRLSASATRAQEDARVAVMYARSRDQAEKRR